MSKEFGRKFTEQREKLGKTIDDMSSETKLRSEYLNAIENGEIDNLEVPSVYLRGFVKTYAKHLRMDVDAIMEECPIRQVEILSSNARRKEMIQKIAKQEQAIDDTAEDREDVGANGTYSYSDSVSKQKISSAIRIAIIAIGSLLALIVAISLIMKLFSGASNNEQAYKNVQQYRHAAQVKNYSITATSDVKIIIRNRDTKEKVFNGTLSTGETKTFEFSAPMQMFYDKGDALVIKCGNDMIYPQPGRGGLEL